MKADFEKYGVRDFEKRYLEYDFSNFDEFSKKYQKVLGWQKLERLSNRKLINHLKEQSDYIVKNCDVFLIVGIGGSYLGAKAVIDAINPYFNGKKPDVYFVGNSLSSEFIVNLKEKIKDKDIIINYVSKSGKTLETKVVFNDLMRIMYEKYSKDEVEKRVIFTTSNQSIVPKNFVSFEIPDDVGGRFSVFTPAALLPILVAGIDIDALLAGAKKIDREAVKQYAVFRNLMIKENKVVEAFVAYEPKLLSLLEWLKQIFAESLGKGGKGILPIGLINSTDLHSTGQYLQEGRKNIFETIIYFEQELKIYIPEYSKDLSEINEIILEATAISHQSSGVPNGLFCLGKLNEENIGKLMQFMMEACFVCGYLEEANPFDQEGVEVYKKEIVKRLEG